MPKQIWLPEFDLTKLRLKMAAQGISVNEAARICGIARSNMSAILNGHRKSLPAIAKLAQRVGVDLTELTQP